MYVCPNYIKRIHVLFLPCLYHENFEILGEILVGTLVGKPLVFQTTRAAIVHGVYRVSRLTRYFISHGENARRLGSGELTMLSNR